MSDQTMYKATISKQEQCWIKEQRITRITDDKEVLIYPMGAERYLSSVLSGKTTGRYNIKADIEGKNILIIPGYGNSAFLLSQAGAESITVYDKDPVTIAWIKAFKKYYYYREYTRFGKPYPSIGELLNALTSWYPPLIKIPSGTIKNALLWGLNPKGLRRVYIYYMLKLVRQAIDECNQSDYELDKNINFFTGELHQLIKSKPQVHFDSAYIPYLLGVRNGIEHEKKILQFIKELSTIVPNGKILVTPSRNTKEFHFTGQRYFVTTEYSNIQDIPGLTKYFITEDRLWFKTQGLAVFGLHDMKKVQKDSSHR